MKCSSRRKREALTCGLVATGNGPAPCDGRRRLWGGNDAVEVELCQGEETEDRCLVIARKARSFLHCYFRQLSSWRIAGGGGMTSEVITLWRTVTGRIIVWCSRKSYTLMNRVAMTGLPALSVLNWVGSVRRV